MIGPYYNNLQKINPYRVEQAVILVVFDSYEKEEGTRKTEYGIYGRMKSDGSAKNLENEAFEHVIRYDDGINSDFVLASCSVPVNYDYIRLNVQTRTLAVEQQG